MLVQERKRSGSRFGCWFYVALVAVLANPLVWRLLANLLGLVVQFIGSHLMFL